MNSEKFKKSIEYLEGYAEVTEEVKSKLKAHIKRYNLTDEICAWYADWEDFCSDWCDDNGYTRTQARSLLHGGKGEFKIIEGFGIVRFAM